MILNCISFELSIFDWTTVGVIASFCMIAVTAWSIIVSLHQNKMNRESNERENNSNRELQLRAIRYQTKITWINQLKEAIAYAEDLLNFSIHDRFIGFNKQANQTSINSIIPELFENGNKAKRKLVIVLYGCGQYEDNFLSFVDSFCIRYFNFIVDLQFLHSLDFSSIDQETLKTKTESYKQKRSSSIRQDNRIWSIIESRDYKTSISDLTYYINELTKKYQFEDFEQRCINLLNYELTLANKMLNETEKDR